MLITLLETCNHHEVDTRIVRHVSLSDKPVVIVAADTDIFVLLIYAFHKSHPSEKLFMKIKKNKYLEPGYRWHLQGLWRGDLWRIAWLSVLQGVTLLHIHTRLETWNHSRQEVKVIWQNAPHGGPIPRLGVTPVDRNLYHWIPGVGVPISVP